MTALVLLIEDDEASSKLMSYLLESAGLRVLTASDGAEGLRMALGHDPDLILCDLQLPEMDGFEVLAGLRSHREPGRPPVVAVTALAMVGDRTRVLGAGFDGYITKPIEPRTFVDQLEIFWMEGHHPSDGEDTHRR